MSATIGLEESVVKGTSNPPGYGGAVVRPVLVTDQLRQRNTSDAWTVTDTLPHTMLGEGAGPCLFPAPKGPEVG